LDLGFDFEDRFNYLNSFFISFRKKWN